MCRFDLLLNNGEHIQMKQVCEIVRMKQNKHTNHPNLFVTFTEILETERQKIIKFCFERQLALKERGLL